MKTVKVEFLIAFTNGTWTLGIYNVPKNHDTDASRISWANKNIKDYKDVTLFAIYGYPQGDEDECGTD